MILVPVSNRYTFHALILTLFSESRLKLLSQSARADFLQEVKSVYLANPVIKEEAYIFFCTLAGVAMPEDQQVFALDFGDGMYILPSYFWVAPFLPSYFWVVGGVILSTWKNFFPCKIHRVNSQVNNKSQLSSFRYFMSYNTLPLNQRP